MRDRFSESSYEITVLLDNGAYAVAQRRDGARFRVGDRVSMRGIELELLKP
jgi:outer membrane lipoprotein SlyB